MDKLKMTFAAAMICLVVSIAYAGYFTVTWNQNPQVALGFQVYKADGTTKINEGTDQTLIWAWDGVTHSFNATIKIDNEGDTNTNVNITISGLADGWTAYGFGTQTAITPTELRTVNLSIVNPLASAGSYVPFSITASKA
jgi:uncharacterized membrane protein